MGNQGFHTEIGLPHVGTTFCCTPQFTARARAPCKLHSLLLCCCLQGIFIGTAMATFNSTIAIAADQLATVVSLDFAHTLEGSTAMDPSFLRKAPTASATPGTSPVGSLHASSRSPSRTKRPLVLLRPRGDGSPALTGATPGSLSARCVSC